MGTRYEQAKRCVINFNATVGWRENAHQRAASQGMTLTDYIKALVEEEATEPTWRLVADDLYEALRQATSGNPYPQNFVDNALTAYQRKQQGRT